MGRAAVLSAQPDRPGPADATARHADAPQGSRDPRTDRRHCLAARTTGDDQGNRRRPRHGGHCCALRYISKNGRLEIEDDRGVPHRGKEALHDLADQWRYGGALISEEGHRREAFNIMLSMPRGTDAGIVHRAAREFAKAELAGHRYVMVLHEHQVNPHVHLSVRATARDGSRLNPRKTDLHRWRETFAEKLRGWGVEAEATRQATRGESRRFDPIWRLKARDEGRLAAAAPSTAKSGEAYTDSRLRAMEAWVRIGEALKLSDLADDQARARDIVHFLRKMPYAKELARQRQRDLGTPTRGDVVRPTQTMQRSGPDIER